MQGQQEEGIAQMHQGLTALRATGTEVNLTYYLALLAEVYGQKGQTDEGLCIVAEALTGVQSGRECWWEAELQRLRGKLLLVQADTKQQIAEAEQCFQQALAIARHQQAKALELRAAMSLSRLWQAHGKRTAARQILAEIYNWFTEGFDTADLQTARTLLAALV
jgi:predicted ATPase